MDEKQRIEKIGQIIDRAEDMKLRFDRHTLFMDLRYVDDKMGLKLDEFLSADETNFVHDIYGIQKNFNRETKEMDNFFLPRFAKSE